MQATLNFDQNNADRRGSHDDVSHRMAQVLKLFGLRIPPAILICLILLTARGTAVAQTISQATKPAEQSDGQKAFEKMKTLAGSWQGTIRRISINVTIRVASSGTAILNEANTDGGRPPNHEITMFYMEGDRLLATHYCDAGNRARFEGRILPDGKTIEFSFLDVAGSTQGGLVKRMAFTVVDPNKQIVEFTFILPERKPMELRGEFQRTND